MLPPFIIEQIRQREIEEAREREQQRPVLELPIHVPIPPAQTEEEEVERGVIVIDLMG
jgi:hypothetical protein